jgi:hypothetical protein
VALEDFAVRNPKTGAILKALPNPPMLLDLMLHGGLYPHLERQGLVEAIKAGGKHRVRHAPFLTGLIDPETVA